MDCKKRGDLSDENVARSLDLVVTEPQAGHGLVQ